MSGLSPWIDAHDGLVLLAQLLIWAATLVFAAPLLLRAARGAPRWLLASLLVLSLAAAGISLFVVPSLDRFLALGHEASYFDCYLGASPPGSEGGWEPYVTYPLLRWTYWALGRLLPGDGPTVPLVFNALVRGAGVVAIGAIGAVLGRRAEVGLAAAAILTLHSVHAFWGGGLYNVPLPHLFVLLSTLLALLAWRSGESRLLLAAAASGAMVVAGRVEWGLLAPSLLVLLLGLGPRWGRSPRVKTARFWVGPLLLTGGLAVPLALGGGQLTEQGGYEGVRGYLVTAWHQAGMLELFEPLDPPWLLLGAGLGAWSWWRRGDVGPAGPLGLLGFLLVSWLGISTFNDASYRHALLPGMALVLGLGMLAPALLRSGPLRALAAGILVLTLAREVSALGTTAHRYYMSPEAFVEDQPAFRGREIPAEELEGSGCYLITDDERLWRMGLAGSQFNLMDPGEAVKRWRHHRGCIYWIYDASNYRQDGLAARARGQKLRRWFHWQELGWARFPDGLEAVVYRMTEPPWGVQDDDPIPPTDVLMPWEQEEEP